MIRAVEPWTSCRPVRYDDRPSGGKATAAEGRLEPIDRVRANDWNRRDSVTPKHRSERGFPPTAAVRMAVSQPRPEGRLIGDRRFRAPCATVNRALRERESLRGATARASELMDAKPHTREGVELDLLARVIKQYEDDNP